MPSHKKYSEINRKLKNIPFVIGYVFKSGKKYLATYNYPKSEKNHRVMYNLYDIKSGKLVSISRLDNLIKTSN